MPEAALYPQVQQASGAVDYVHTRQGGSGSGQGQVGYQLGLNMAWELDF